MQKILAGVFATTKMLVGFVLILIPGFVFTWTIFALAFPDTLQKADFSQLENAVFSAGTLGFSYLAYTLTSWRRVVDIVAPKHLYDDWLGSRGD